MCVCVVCVLCVVCVVCVCALQPICDIDDISQVGSLGLLHKTYEASLWCDKISRQAYLMMYQWRQIRLTPA